MKVDKGFKFFYHNLSYRRKFIRTIWCIPAGVIALVLLYIVDSEIPPVIPPIVKVVLVAVLAITLVVQLIYTYKRYLKEKAEQTDYAER